MKESDAANKRAATSPTTGVRAEVRELEIEELEAITGGLVEQTSGTRGQFDLTTGDP